MVLWKKQLHHLAHSSKARELHQSAPSWVSVLDKAKSRASRNSLVRLFDKSPIQLEAAARVNYLSAFSAFLPRCLPSPQPLCKGREFK